MSWRLVFTSGETSGSILASCISTKSVDECQVWHRLACWPMLWCSLQHARQIFRISNSLSENLQESSVCLVQCTWIEPCEEFCYDVLPECKTYCGTTGGFMFCTTYCAVCRFQLSASAERAMSKLKIIKNWLRTSLADKTMSALMIKCFSGWDPGGCTLEWGTKVSRW